MVKGSTIKLNEITREFRVYIPSIVVECPPVTSEQVPLTQLTPQCYVVLRYAISQSRLVVRDALIMVDLVVYDASQVVTVKPLFWSGRDRNVHSLQELITSDDQNSPAKQGLRQWQIRTLAYIHTKGWDMIDLGIQCISSVV